MSITENETSTQEVITTTNQITSPNPLKPKKAKKDRKSKPTAAQMTFFEHLGELRNRLVFSAIAVVLTTIIGWVFSRDMIEAFLGLAKPAIDEAVSKGQPKPNFQVLDLFTSFSVYFEVALYAGLLLASPVIVYHILAFLAPALEPELKKGDPGYDEEVKMLGSIRRSLVFFVPLVAIFFVVGVAFAYYLVLPPSIKFLIGFGEGQFTVNPDVKKYISLLTKVMFWSGLVFELPIFLFLLAKIRVVTWRKLASLWKYALVLSMVAAAFITPSPDLLSQAVISVPVFGLFWLGVLFARFA